MIRSGQSTYIVLYLEAINSKNKHCHAFFFFLHVSSDVYQFNPLQRFGITVSPVSFCEEPESSCFSVSTHFTAITQKASGSFATLICRMDKHLQGNFPLSGKWKVVIVEPALSPLHCIFFTEKTNDGQRQ